jgi:hypothetical protein
MLIAVCASLVRLGAPGYGVVVSDAGAIRAASARENAAR